MLGSARTEHGQPQPNPPGWKPCYLYQTSQHSRVIPTCLPLNQHGRLRGIGPSGAARQRTPPLCQCLHKAGTPQPCPPSNISAPVPHVSTEPRHLLIPSHQQGSTLHPASSTPPELALLPRFAPQAHPAGGTPGAPGHLGGPAVRESQNRPKIKHRRMWKTQKSLCPAHRELRNCHGWIYSQDSYQIEEDLNWRIPSRFNIS